jgi:hypothetical protein
VDAIKSTDDGKITVDFIQMKDTSFVIQKSNKLNTEKLSIGYTCYVVTCHKRSNKLYEIEKILYTKLPTFLRDNSEYQMFTLFGDTYLKSKQPGLITFSGNLLLCDAYSYTEKQNRRSKVLIDVDIEKISVGEKCGICFICVIDSDETHGYRYEVIDVEPEGEYKMIPDIQSLMQSPKNNGGSYFDAIKGVSNFFTKIVTDSLYTIGLGVESGLPDSDKKDDIQID